MDDERFRDQREVAKYAILCGVEATSKKYNLSPAILTSWVNHLDFDDLRIFSELRKIVRDVAMRKGVAVAAKDVEVSEKLMETFVATMEEPAKFVEARHQNTQTPEFIPCKRTRTECETQTLDLPPEPPAGSDSASTVAAKKYTTAQKLRGVKAMLTFRNEEEAAVSLQIPHAKLMRWKAKIKSALFQEQHVQRLYGARPREEKDRFFFELDEALYKWWQANQQQGQNVDQLLTEKAKSIAKIDDAMPVVSPAWVTSFRAFYKV